MRPLVARAPGKVNLALLLGPTREDGLHELVSLVQSVSLADEVRLGPGEGASDEVHCPWVDGPNLAGAALGAFRKEAGWRTVPLRLTIAKQVPVAAGMGGGSGDAAAALRLATAAAASVVPHGNEVARRVAPGLGADVPAQLEPGLHLVGGAGEEVEPVAPRASFGVLVLPGPDPLPTPAVFAEADRLGLGRTSAELAVRRTELAAALADERGLPPLDLLVNDLEPAARSLAPEIDLRLAAARDAGADHALVSGSGPTVFGLFAGGGGPEAAAAAAPALGGVAGVPVDAAWSAAREAGA